MQPLQGTFAAARVALRVLGEIVAPTCCAACDEPVASYALFCAACGESVERARGQRAGTLAVFSYGGSVATAIVRMKYAGRSDLAPRLGRAMALAIGDHAREGDVVVSVPLHAARLAERGFDQAGALASAFARATYISHEARALQRVRDTPRQAALARDVRAVNVEGAFVCKKPSRVRGRRVLLVDDVRTTGATLRACTAELRRAGACEVIGVVLAWRERDLDG
jgi:ComF family protein